MATTYTVQLHDNLTKIAKAHNTTVDSLVRLNNISHPDTIYTGQKLIFEETKPAEESKAKSEETAKAADGSQAMPMMDGFQAQNTTNNAVKALNELKAKSEELKAQLDNKKTEAKAEEKTEAKEKDSSVSPLLIGAVGGVAGAVAVKGTEKAAPYVKKGYNKAATAFKEAAEKVPEKANAVKKEAANKAALGKESLKNNYQAVKNFLAKKAKAAKYKALRATVKTKNAFKSAKNVVIAKKNAAVDATKSGLTRAKNATLDAAKKAAKKVKVGGRYVKLIGNTKVAPAVLKGVSRAAGPLAAIAGAVEVATAYKKGGADAAVKQAPKTVAGIGAAWGGAKIGAAIGSVGGPIGTVVGGAIGGVVGYFAGEWAIGKIMG